MNESLLLSLVNQNTFRSDFLHLINFLFRAYLQNGREFSNLSLSDTFLNVDVLSQENMIDRLFRGLVKQPVEKVDHNFVDAVSVY